MQYFRAQQTEFNGFCVTMEKKYYVEGQVITKANKLQQSTVQKAFFFFFFLRAKHPFIAQPVDQ